MILFYKSGYYEGKDQCNNPQPSPSPLEGGGGLRASQLNALEAKERVAGVILPMAGR